MERVRIRSKDGIGLSGLTWPGVGQPLLFLHGGGQTAWSWQATAGAMQAAGLPGLAVDLRGHGASDWAQSGGYGLHAFASDVHAWASTFDQAPVVVGASLGGISALHAQSLQPFAHALVLVDITLRWEKVGLARILGFLSAHQDGFATLEEAAEAVAAYLPHRKRSRNPESLRKNLRRDADGRWRFHFDPAMIKEAGDESARWGETLESSAARLNIPTLLLRGRHSDVVSDRTVAHFFDHVPQAQYRVIDDAAHMVAGDSNAAFTHAVMDFITQLGPVDLARTGS